MFLRALALVLGVWFPLVAGEPGLFDPCPMHGAIASGRTHATGMGGADMGSEARGAGHRPASPRHQHHDCTCIGCCSGAVAALRAPEAATIEVATVVISSARALPTLAALPRPAPAFSRPYTTGPPPLA